MRILRQVLTESVVLSAAGGLVGLALAPAALSLLVNFAKQFTERASEVRMDAPVLFFTLGISIATGVLFGLAPALFSGEWIGSAFRQAGNWSTTSRGRHRLRSMLVIAQVAVSVTLLAGAGLMIRSFARLEQVPPGFIPDRLLTLRVSPPFPPYTMANVKQLGDRIVTKVRATAGVESVAMASSFPFNPTGLVSGPNLNQYEIEGQPFSKADVTPTVDLRVASANYFETLHQPIVKGRAFVEHDEHRDTQTAIINETMARRRFPHQDPVGKHLRFGQGPDNPWSEIVGVAADVREYGLNQPVGDEVFLAFRNGFVSRLIVRTAQDPDRMTPTLRAALHEVDPLLAIDRVESVERAEYESMTSPRVMTLLLTIFAGLAVVISASGIAAVMALAVSQRTREIGVRMALGAQAGSIVRMVLRQGLSLALVGTVVGMAGAAALTRLLASLLYGTSPTDSITFTVVPLFFLLVAAIACFIPARLVTSIDPTVALREE